LGPHSLSARIEDDHEPSLANNVRGGIRVNS
jgi:hypothetical protein